jgi:hypothetical protein
MMHPSKRSPEADAAFWRVASFRTGIVSMQIDAPVAAGLSRTPVDADSRLTPVGSRMRFRRRTPFR